MDVSLLTAAHWLSQALVQPASETAFLFMAIALESLLLPERDEELTYRLAERGALLLGKEVNQRKEISGRIKKLYSIRSRIVHNGGYEVSVSDLEELRSYCVFSVLRFLRDDELRTLKTGEEFVEWVDTQRFA